MKILFVWDCAGVSCILAKYLRKLGHECDVIIRKEYDTFGFFDFYEEQSLNVDSKTFDDISVSVAKEYDIIHVSSAFRLAKRIKNAYPEKKVVLEYHGSDARLTPLVERIGCENAVDKILISTVDLYDYVNRAEWLPNPVDTDHFKPTGHTPGALFINKKGEELPTTPFQYTTVYREDTPMPYKNMPQFLSNYHVYVDIKNYADVGLLKPLSKTALEALATGMKVYTSDRIMIEGLPERHEAENVTLKLLEIYKKL